METAWGADFRRAGRQPTAGVGARFHIMCPVAPPGRAAPPGRFQWGKPCVVWWSRARAYDKAMVTFARTERAALSELLRHVGPDAPTLCEGWATADLAAHLVARERRPDHNPGLLLPSMRGWTDRVRNGIKQRPFTELVHLIETGPPRLSQFGLIPGLDSLVNSAELFIHHEDVRRARPGWEPRELPAEVEARLWQRLRQGGRAFFRRAPVGVVLRTPGGETVTVKRGSPTVTLTGKPSELLLYGFGRGDHARVAADGDAAAVGSLSATRFGF